MATVKPNRNPTLADVVTRLDAKGNLADISEVLSQTNEMLDDITFMECNQKHSHITTVRSGLPEVTWRKLNYGVQPSKSQTKQVTDTCGMCEAYAVVDTKLVELNGKRESWRASENTAFIEAMNQEVQKALFYADSSVDPQKFMGLAPRFNTTDPKVPNSVNVIDCKGTGNNLTSIWVVVWGPHTVHCLYPEGSQAGLKEEDLGKGIETDPDGGKYQVYQTHYEWDLGLTVRDWRYVVRIANIDVTKLKARPVEKDLNLIDTLVDALEKIPNLSAGRAAIYCNKTIRALLRKQIRYADNVNITMDEVAGKPVVKFDGVPVRRCDALTCEEKQVTAA